MLILRSATNAFLIFPELALADAGDYRVNIRNAQGTVTSQPIPLDVVVSSNRPRLLLSRAGPDLRLDCWLRLSEGTLRIYSAPTIAALASEAELVHEGPMPGSRRYQLTIPDWAGAGQRFYRLVELPPASGN